MVVMKSSPHPVPTQPSPQGGGPAFLPPSLRRGLGWGVGEWPGVSSPPVNPHEPS